MKKDVIPYKQKGNTCVICTMLMILDYYQKLDIPKWYFERKYYKIYKSRYIQGTPLSAVMYHLTKNNLKCKLYHSEKNLFKNDGYLDNDTFNSLLFEYKEFIDLSKTYNSQVNNNVLIDCTFLKEQLMNNNLIILSGIVNNVLHAVLLIGYENNMFYVCDPLYKNESLWDKDKINEFVATLEKMGITVTVRRELGSDISASCGQLRRQNGLKEDQI